MFASSSFRCSSTGNISRSSVSGVSRVYLSLSRVHTRDIDHISVYAVYLRDVLCGLASSLLCIQLISPSRLAISVTRHHAFHSSSLSLPSSRFFSSIVGFSFFLDSFFCLFVALSPGHNSLIRHDARFTPPQLHRHRQAGSDSSGHSLGNSRRRHFSVSVSRGVHRNLPKLPRLPRYNRDIYPTYTRDAAEMYARDTADTWPRCT